MKIDKTEYIQKNQGLIVRLAKRYAKLSHLYEYEDLVQVGNMSMWKKLDKYDPSKSEPSTFLTICISRDMIKYIKKIQKHTDNLPITMKPEDKRGVFDEMYVEDIISSYSEIEQEIIRLKMDGASNMDICKKICRPMFFVKKELKKIKEKL